MNPLHAPSHAYLGDVFFRENKSIEAEEYFRRAINLQFDNLTALSGLVRLAKNEKNEFNELAELLKDAYFRGANNQMILMELLSFQNSDPKFYLQIAEELQAQKSYHRAVFFYRLALRENPENKAIQAKLNENLKHLNIQQD